MSRKTENDSVSSDSSATESISGSDTSETESEVESGFIHQGSVIKYCEDGATGHIPEENQFVEPSGYDEQYYDEYDQSYLYFESLDQMKSGADHHEYDYVQESKQTGKGQVWKFGEGEGWEDEGAYGWQNGGAYGYENGHSESWNHDRTVNDRGHRDEQYYSYYGNGEEYFEESNAYGDYHDYRDSNQYPENIDYHSSHSRKEKRKTHSDSHRRSCRHNHHDYDSDDANSQWWNNPYMFNPYWVMQYHAANQMAASYQNYVAHSQWAQYYENMFKQQKRDERLSATYKSQKEYIKQMAKWMARKDR